MPANLILSPQLQFSDQDGAPLAGGLLYSYIPDTLTEKATWQDKDETIYNTNPIILDVRGACVVFGEGDYRFILTDANGVQIFDLLSSAPLAASAVGAILPCLGQQTLQGFMDCAGITAALQNLASNISLMPGPTGPAGPVGPTGPSGPAGSAGQDATFPSSLTQPGYVVLGQYGNAAMIQWGQGTTDSTGKAQVTYAWPFAVANFANVCTAIIPDLWVMVTQNNTNAGFTAISNSPFAGGLWNGGPIPFAWISIGI